MGKPVNAMDATRMRPFTPLGAALAFVFVVVVGSFALCCFALDEALRLLRSVFRRLRPRPRPRALGGTPATDSGLIMAIGPACPKPDPARAIAEACGDHAVDLLANMVAVHRLPEGMETPRHMVRPMTAETAAQLDAHTGTEPAWTVERMAAYITSLVALVASQNGVKASQATVRVRVPKAIWHDPLFLPVLAKLGVNARQVEQIVTGADVAILAEAGLAI